MQIIYRNQDYCLEWTKGIDDAVRSNIGLGPDKCGYCSRIASTGLSLLALYAGIRLATNISNRKNVDMNRYVLTSAEGTVNKTRVVRTEKSSALERYAHRA